MKGECVPERAHIVRWARGGSAPAFDGQLVLALPGQQAVALQDQLAHLVPPDPCRAWSGRVLRHVGGGPVGGDALDAVGEGGLDGVVEDLEGGADCGRAAGQVGVAREAFAVELDEGLTGVHLSLDEGAQGRGEPRLEALLLPLGEVGDQAVLLHFGGVFLVVLLAGGWVGFPVPSASAFLRRIK